VRSRDRVVQCSMARPNGTFDILIASSYRPTCHYDMGTGTLNLDFLLLFVLELQDWYYELNRHF